MNKKTIEKINKIIKKQGVIKPKDLDNYGIPRNYLWRLYKSGELEHLGHGLYAIKNYDFPAHYSIAQVSKRIPRAVICLISALDFHELTTQIAFEVWIAIDHKDRKPISDYPPLRVVRFSGDALREGIEKHNIDGVTVKVYKPAKTVADCFKYRNKIGLDIALEALRDCWKQKKCTMDELWHYAKICRVSNIMRPYLESLV